MELREKVSLSEKGQSIALREKADPDGPFQAVLRWRASVDLDLHCFYRLKFAARTARPTGVFGKIRAAFVRHPDRGHVSFANKGRRDKAPWITLDVDAGVGDLGGNNEENLHFHDIHRVECALICANIYGKPDARFASFDGSVIVRGAGREFEVPLTETSPGVWCVVAQIDNSTDTPRLINVNRTQHRPPDIDDY